MDKDLQVSFDLTTEIMEGSLSDAQKCLTRGDTIPDVTSETISVAIVLFNARFGLMMAQARDLQKVSGFPV